MAATYIRGITERGIDYDAQSGEFYLSRPNADALRFLDKNFEQVAIGRWRIRKLGLVGKVVQAGTSVFSGLLAEDDPIVEQRRASCFAGPCALLARDENGSYCKECGCGRHYFANLDGGVLPKLRWKTLDCPLKMPGFSNEVK